MIDELESLSVDFLILADRAEVVNGKLYAMGAAWDRIGVADFTQPLTISLAIGVLVPWNATNRPHALVLTVRDADGQPIDFKVEANFVTGRPPMLNGETQRVLLAVPSAGLKLPAPGNYEMVASIDGVEAKTVRFTASPGPPQPSPPSG